MEVMMFSKEPSTVTLQNLFDMPPHQRTECLALMRERGLSEDKIGRQLGVSLHALARIIDARHQYSLPSAAEDQPTADYIPDKVMAKVDISRNALLLLRRVALYRQGWTAGKTTIARETGISEGAVETAIIHLLGAEMIVRLGRPGRGRPACYSATPKGAALLASLAVEA